MKDKDNKLQPTWTNEPSVKDLEADYDAASDSQEEIRKELLRWELDKEGGKKIKARPGRSTVRPKVIRSTYEWKIPALSEPFLNTENMFEVRPRTFEDVDGAEQNALLLNYQWATKIDKVQLVGDIVRTIVEEGTVILKTGWDVVEEIEIVQQEQPVYANAEQSLKLLEQAVLAGDMSPEEAAVYMEEGQPMQIGTEMVDVEVPKLIKNQPSYEVCNTANVTIDPTCKGYIKNAKFIVHEYDTNWSELKNKEYIVDEETGAVQGIYKNLDKIKDRDTDTYYDEHETDAYNNFKFNDKARKRLKAYDYWGYWDIQGDGKLVSIVATWVEGVLVRLEENPFPHKRLPFSMATYMPRRKSVTGEPDAELLHDTQEGTGKLLRAIHDITSTQAVGQEFIDERLLSTQSMKNAYEKGNTVYYQAGMDPKSAIHKQSVDPVPATVFNTMNMYQAQQESLSGTKAFTGGISGEALGSSVGGIRSALDATSKRELDVLRRLSNLFKDAARLTIAMNQAYSRPEEVVRVTNKEFVTVRRDSIQGEYDTIVDVSTPEKDAETAEKLNMLMQTNAASMHPEMAAKVYSKIAKLWKQPDLANDLLQPQEPDPAQVEMQQLQLRNLKLEQLKLQKEIEEIDSRINERYSRLEENGVDRTMKNAKAEESLARAELYREQADQLAQDFLDKESGAKDQKEYDKEERQRLAKLDELAFKEMAKGKNNG